MTAVVLFLCDVYKYSHLLSLLITTTFTDSSEIWSGTEFSNFRLSFSDRMHFYANRGRKHFISKGREEEDKRERAGGRAGKGRWLGGVMVRTLDLRLAVAGSNPDHDTAWLFLR